MAAFEMLTTIRERAHKSDCSVNNIAELGLDKGTRAVHILWMYPDVLDMHGDRGNAMAFLHISNLLKLPCEIRKCVHLDDEIPFEWADLMLFPSGDLACMEDISNALRPQKAAFEAYAARGGLIYAISSSGAILAKRTTLLDGTTYDGLGLLNMEFKQREAVFGDDLWIETEDGHTVIGNQIQLADVSLNESQKAFGKVIYGRGNLGQGTEGATSGGVHFTHLTGPLFVKNPKYTEAVLRQCAALVGISVPDCGLNQEDITLELESLEDIKTFIRKKQTV